MPSDGRFRVIVFGGDISKPTQKDVVNDFAARLSADILSKAPKMPLAPGADPHSATMRFKTDQPPSIIDVLLIHTAKRNEIETLRDLHEVYHPFDSKLGWDYDKIFVDEKSYHQGHGKAYEGYGVNPEKGAVVVVRPDGYVGLVTGLENVIEVQKWFTGVLRTV